MAPQGLNVPGVPSIGRRRGLSVPGAAAAAMPSGALGIWYADSYDATKKAIPNSVVATPLSANILRAPRRQLSFSTYWSLGGNTIVDDFGIGPNGLQEATRIAVAGGGIWGYNGNITVPAGTYTLRLDAKSNTGTNQSFKMLHCSAFSPFKTATTSWQTFTFTVSGYAGGSISIYPICAIDGSTATDLLVDNIEFYSGSSDLGPSAPAGHIYLGFSAYDTATSGSYASGEMNMSAGGFGLFQFDHASTHDYGTGFTAIAAVKKVAAGGDYQAWFSTMMGEGRSSAGGAGDYTRFTPFLEFNRNSQTAGQDYFLAGASSVAGLQQFKGAPIDPTGEQYHIITHRYDGNTLDTWFDDYRLASHVVGAKAAGNVVDFFYNCVVGNTLYASYKYTAHALYPSALTDTQVRNAVAFLQTRNVSLGLTNAARPARVWAPDGDSVTGGFYYSYPYLMLSHHTMRVYTPVRAITSQFISNVETNAPLADAVIPPTRNGEEFVYSLLLGTNDLNNAGLNVTTWVNTNIKGRLVEARTAGWDKIIIATVPSSANTNVTTNRAIANPLLRALVTNGFADACFDFDADPYMGDDTLAAAAPNTYFADSIGHPTQAAGQPALQAIAQPVLDNLSNAPAAPVNTSVPTITGTPAVGTRIRGNLGTWTGTPWPLFSFQWYWADTNAVITGATRPYYTPVSGDTGHTLKLRVTATPLTGSPVTAFSVATSTI